MRLPLASRGRFPRDPGWAPGEAPSRRHAPAGGSYTGNDNKKTWLIYAELGNGVEAATSHRPLPRGYRFNDDQLLSTPFTVGKPPATRRAATDDVSSADAAIYRLPSQAGAAGPGRSARE